MQKNAVNHEFLKNKNILIIKPSLVYKAQDSVEILREIIDLIAKYGYPNVLGDFRSLEINFSLRLTREKPSQFKLLGMSKNIKIAFLLDKLEDSNILHIKTLFSHGFKVSAYTNYDEAIKWLSK